MHRLLTRLLLGLVLVIGLMAGRGFAQSSAPSDISTSHSQSGSTSITAERLAQLEQQIADARSSGDNAWMLICAALVLLMTGPGLALFYAGLVRKKNVLATMMQSFTLMALVTVLWALFGYSLVFHEGWGFLGNLGYVFLRGVGSMPNADYAATIPQQTFMVYQLMFAIITPALITGAFAERMKFSAMVLFMALWTVIVYDPMAHMVWGKGGLLNAALGGAFPTLDFAGGTVVHVTSGVSALVCALYLGKRLGYPKEAMPPHSVVLSFIGACLLWVGWFGFNAGSALSAGKSRQQRLCGYAFRCCGGSAGVGCGRVALARKGQRARGHFRSGGRVGCNYARVRVCCAYARAGHRADRWRGLLSYGGQGEGPLRL